MTTTLISRFALATMLGQTFGGSRDLYTVFGYKQNLTFDDFLRRYNRQGIATRIIDAPAQSTWIKQPVIDGGSDKFNKAWEDHALKNDIWNKFERVDRLSGLGTFAGLLMGFSGSNDLKAPVTSATEILYLQPYSEGSLKVSKLIEDSSDPRFGQPETYEVQIGGSDLKGIGGITSPSSTTPSKGRKIEVHWTRIIHVAERLLENNIYGTPRLAPIYNNLEDLDKIVGGSAEMFWLAGNRGLHINIDKDMEMDVEDEAALADEIEEYQHNLRRVLRTRGVDIDSLGSEIADPKGTFDVQVAMISAATGIPRRILLGSEAGQLASEQDRSNWSNRIAERQNDFAEPVILRPYVDRQVLVGTLPTPEDDSYTVSWPTTFEMSPLEQGLTAAQVGRTIANVGKQLQNGQPVLTTDEIRILVGHEPLDRPDTNTLPMTRLELETETETGTKTDPTPDPEGEKETQLEEEEDENERTRTGT